MKGKQKTLQTIHFLFHRSSQRVMRNAFIHQFHTQGQSSSWGTEWAVLQLEVVIGSFVPLPFLFALQQRHTTKRKNGQVAPLLPLRRAREEQEQSNHERHGLAGPPRRAKLHERGPHPLDPALRRAP
ncbi:unnamed protein product [Heterosigma akashiwo]